jgi:hypothetical protein
MKHYDFLSWWTFRAFGISKDAWCAEGGSHSELPELPALCSLMSPQTGEQPRDGSVNGDVFPKVSPELETALKMPNGRVEVVLEELYPMKSRQDIRITYIG